MNIQSLIEEHYEALNAAKDNNTTQTVGEVDKLLQNLEEKEVDVMEICEYQDMLMEKLKSL